VSRGTVPIKLEVPRQRRGDLNQTKTQFLETFEIDADFITDIESLKQNGAVQENHYYYYWDSRTNPLDFWLREQFDFDTTGTEVAEE